MLDTMFDLQQLPVDQPSLQIISKMIKPDAKFNYIKYRQAVKSLLAMQMDEETAKKSTLATAATMGIHKEDIIKSAEEFYNSLQLEEKHFEQALTNQIQSKVEAKRQECVKNEQSIHDIDQKIAALQAEIESLKDKIVVLKQEAADQEKMIFEKKSLYYDTITQFKKLVNEDIQNLKL